MRKLLILTLTTTTNVMPSTSDDNDSLECDMASTSDNQDSLESDIPSTAGGGLKNENTLSTSNNGVGSGTLSTFDATICCLIAKYLPPTPLYNLSRTCTRFGERKVLEGKENYNNEDRTHRSMMGGVAVSMVMDEALFCPTHALTVMTRRPSMTIFGTYYVMYYNLSALPIVSEIVVSAIWRMIGRIYVDALPWK